MASAELTLARAQHGALPPDAPVVVDCLTLWLSNLLLRGDSEDSTLGQVEQLTEMLHGKPFHAILVTNEVGMGIVPELRERGYVFTEARAVDRDGRKVASFNPAVIIESNCIHDNHAAGRGGGIHLYYTTRKAEEVEMQSS